MRKAIGMGILLLAGCQSAQDIPEAPLPVSAPAPQPELTTTTLAPDPPTTEAPTTTTEPEPEPVTVPTTLRVRATTTTEYLQPVATIAARSTSSDLANIRTCESGGNYSTDTGNGYYGAYQFALSTWASVGGSGNPANASPSEQDMRAQMMIDAGRRGEWPNC